MAKLIMPFSTNGMKKAHIFLLSFTLSLLFFFVSPAVAHTPLEISHQESMVIQTSSSAPSGNIFSKFLHFLKEKIGKIERNLPAARVSAAATRAIIEMPKSPEKEEKSSVYVNDINHELLLNGINYNSKSVFASSKFKEKSRQAIMTLLNERKKLLISLVHENPKLLGAYALPLLTKSLMPAEAQGLYEEEETITAPIQVFHMDDFLNEENSTFTYQLLVKGQKINFYPTKPINVTPGSTVTVHGLTIGGFMVGDVTSPQRQSLPIIPIEENEENEMNDPGALALKVTEHKMAVILVKFNDAPVEPFSIAEAGTIVFGSQFQAFYSQQSYNKIHFSGDVFGWYTINRPTNACDNLSLGWGGDLDPLIASNGINLANYQHVLVVTNCAQNFAKGYSLIGSNNAFYVNNQTYNLSLSWVNASGAMFLQNSLWAQAYPPTFQWRNVDFMISHEIGHALGLYHAWGRDCGNVSINTSSLTGCTYVEYGNPFDIMGNGNAYALHTNAFYKEILGWITSGNSLIATASGSYTIGKLEATGVNKKMLKIQKYGTTLTPYYVEWRGSTGFDANLANSALSSNKNGLLITRAYSDGAPPYYLAHLIDARPTSSIWSDDTKAASFNSTTGMFSDPRNGITIGPITAKTSSLITFNVGISPVACTRVAPKFKDPETAGLHAVANAQFILYPTIWNDNYVGCSPSNFNVTMSLPSGFSSSTNSYMVNALPSEEASQFPMPIITVSSSINPGNYNVGVTVTDQTGGLSSSSNIPIVIDP